MFAKVKQFYGHVVPGVIRPLRVLWHEVLGLIFMIFGLVFGYRTYLFYEESEKGLGELGITAGMALFSAMFIWFGLTSFLRAKKISRSR
jgi:hypothetical protein